MPEKVEVNMARFLCPLKTRADRSDAPLGSTTIKKNLPEANTRAINPEVSERLSARQDSNRLEGLCPECGYVELRSMHTQSMTPDIDWLLGRVGFAWYLVSPPGRTPFR